MRQIADHYHIDVLAAFDGHNRFLMDAISGVNARGRLSCGLASLRNELRLNVFFTTYNTLKLLTERRTLKPVRKAPSIDADPPGLDWLSSRGQSRPQ